MKKTLNLKKTIDIMCYEDEVVSNHTKIIKITVNKEEYSKIK
jgi:hypothetical protein